MDPIYAFGTVRVVFHYHCHTTALALRTARTHLHAYTHAPHTHHARTHAAPHAHTHTHLLPATPVHDSVRLRCSAGRLLDRDALLLTTVPPVGYIQFIHHTAHHPQDRVCLCLPGRLTPLTRPTLHTTDYIRLSSDGYVGWITGCEHSLRTMGRARTHTHAIVRRITWFFVLVPAHFPPPHFPYPPTPPLGYQLFCGGAITRSLFHIRSVYTFPPLRGCHLVDVVLPTPCRNSLRPAVKFTPLHCTTCPIPTFPVLHTGAATTTLHAPCPLRDVHRPHLPPTRGVPITSRSLQNCTYLDYLRFGLRMHSPQFLHPHTTLLSPTHPRWRATHAHTPATRTLRFPPHAHGPRVDVNTGLPFFDVQRSVGLCARHYSGRYSMRTIVGSWDQDVLVHWVY